MKQHKTKTSPSGSATIRSAGTASVSPSQSVVFTSNKQAGRVASASRRSSQISVTSSGVSASSGSSARSSTINGRTESETAFLSRITLCQSTMESDRTQDRVYRITKLSRLASASNSGLTSCHDISFRRDDEKLISLRLPQVHVGTRIILNIPVKLLYYDTGDQPTVQCLREGHFNKKRNNCRVTQLEYYISVDGRKAVLLRRPLFSVDGGRACTRIDEMDVIGYIGNYNPRSKAPPSFSEGDLEIRNRTHSFQISWSTLSFADETGNKSWLGFEKREIWEQRETLEKWIGTNRLVVRNVGLNSFNRPMGATLVLLKTKR